MDIWVIFFIYFELLIAVIFIGVALGNSQAGEKSEPTAGAEIKMEVLL